MIELYNTSVTIAERTLVHPLNLTLGEQRIAIIGSNGSGKSTFARLLNGLLLPSDGDVLIDGISTGKDARTIRKKVGFVFQNPDNQVVFPTVAEDLAFGLKNLGLGSAETRQRVAIMLAQLGLSGFDDRLIHLLSGGEKQLVALAGVLVMSPQTIVFDEPTTLLDRKNKRLIYTTIDALSQQVILITHDLAAINHYDRTLCFEDGRLVCDDKPAVVIDYYKTRTDEV